MKHLLFIILFLSGLLIWSESEAQIRIKGTVYDYDDNKDLVDISVYEDGKPYATLTSTKKGKFWTRLEIGHNYLFTFSKSFHYTTQIVIDTKLPREKQAEGFEGEFLIEVDLVESFAGLDHRLMDQPIMILKYIPEEGRFDFDKQHLTKVRRELEALLYEAEEMKRKGVARVESPKTELFIQEPSSVTVEEDDPVEEEVVEERSTEKQTAEKTELVEQKDPTTSDENTSTTNTKTNSTTSTITDNSSSRDSRSSDQPSSTGKEASNNMSDDKETIENRSDTASRTLELAEIRRQNEAAKREEETIRNKAIKRDYENNLIKQIAAEDKEASIAAKERKTNKLEVAAKGVQIEKEKNLKQYTSERESKIQEEQQKTNSNKVIKTQFNNSLILAIAKTNKEKKQGVKKKDASIATSGRTRVHYVRPMVVQRTIEENNRTIDLIEVEYPAKTIVYRREKGNFGDFNYLRNGELISKTQFCNELQKLLDQTNKLGCGN